MQAGDIEIGFINAIKIEENWDSLRTNTLSTAIAISLLYTSFDKLRAALRQEEESKDQESSSFKAWFQSKIQNKKELIKDVFYCVPLLVVSIMLFFYLALSVSALSDLFQSIKKSGEHFIDTRRIVDPNSGGLYHR